MAYSEIKDDCIICLTDEPDIIRYDAPCECKPYIHPQCINMWFAHNPNICPICKQDYERIGAPPLMTLINRMPIYSNLYLITLMVILFSLFVYLEYFL